MKETALVMQWQADLDALVTQSPNGFVRCFPPRIVVKRGRFSPPWLPPAWLNNKPGAWTFWHYVIVSEALLDCPVSCRHYLLSHEFGHLHALHHLRALLALVTIAAVQFLFPVVRSVGIAHPRVVVVASFFLLVLGCFGCILLFRSYGLVAEYQADTFAADTCGQPTVIEGMLWLARTSGRGITRTLRERLKRLGYDAPKYV
jgi:hypothetical protein